MQTYKYLHWGLNKFNVEKENDKFVSSFLVDRDSIEDYKTLFNNFGMDVWEVNCMIHFKFTAEQFKRLYVWCKLNNIKTGNETLFVP